MQWASSTAIKTRLVLKTFDAKRPRQGGLMIVSGDTKTIIIDQEEWTTHLLSLCPNSHTYRTDTFQQQHRQKKPHSLPKLHSHQHHLIALPITNNYSCYLTLYSYHLVGEYKSQRLHCTYLLVHQAIQRANDQGNCSCTYCQWEDKHTHGLSSPSCHPQKDIFPMG